MSDHRLSHQSTLPEAASWFPPVCRNTNWNLYVAILKDYLIPWKRLQIHQNSLKTLNGSVSLPWQIVGIQMITERVKKQFFHSFIRRVIRKNYVFDAPWSFKGVFISVCWNPEVINPTKKKKFSAHASCSRVSCHCPPSANAECQQKAIVL